MSYTFNATNSVLYADGTFAAENESFTIFAWVYYTDATPATAQYAYSFERSDLTSNSATGRLNAAASSVLTSGGVTDSSTTSAFASDGTWHAIAGLYTATGSGRGISSTQAWGCSGVGGTEYYGTADTSGTSFSGWPQRFSIGSKYGNSIWTGGMAGKIAHVAIWNSVLDSSAMTQLASLSPDQVSSGTLVAYWPLLTDANSSVGSFNLTNVGSNATLSSGDGPAISLGGTSVAPLAMGAYSRMRNG